MANYKIEQRDVRLTDGKFITNQDVCANNLDVTTDIVAGGNVTAQYFIGDGSQLTNLPGGGGGGTGNGDVSNTYLHTQLDLKADNTYVYTTFASNTYVNTQLDLKADNTYVNSTFATNTYVNTQLDTKADNTYVNSTFATNTYVNTQLDLKADILTAATNTYVNLQLDTKADNTYVNSTFATNTYVNTALGDKADNTYVNSTFATNTYVNTELDTKADNTYVNTSLDDKAINTYVNTTFASNTYVNTQLDTKADNTYVNTTFATNTYVNTSLDGKATNTYVNTQLDTKADNTYVNTTFSTNTYVNAGLDTKADNTYVNTSLDGKADNTYVNTSLDGKADNTYVNTTFATNTYVNGTFATPSDITTAIDALVDSSPGTLDTLNELAAALGDDPNFASTVTTSLGLKLDATSYTAADVLTKIKTVDGTTSGLDADLLDGQEGSYYLDYTNFTNTPTIPTGDVIKVGTPVDNQIGVWTGDGTIEGDADFTWSGTNLNVNGQATFNYTSTSDPVISLVSTEAGSSASPEMELYKNSASPANGDYLGQLKFAGENSSGGKKNFAKITGKVSDVTAGAEDGLIEFALQKAGSLNIGARLTHDALKLINGTAIEVDGNATADAFVKDGGLGTEYLMADGTVTVASAANALSVNTLEFTGSTSTSQTIDSVNYVHHDAYFNGIKLNNSLFTIGAANTITLNGITPTADDLLQVVSYSGYAIAAAGAATNTYVNATFATNTYVNSTFSTNTYVNTSLDAKADNTYVNSTFTQDSDFTVTLLIKNSAGTTLKTMKSIA